MSELPGAQQSPRIVNGVIKWYQGDTFDLNIYLNMMDQDGMEVIIGGSDTVTVVFKDKTNTEIKTFTFDSISNNTISLDFDSICTALFPKGKYFYDIYYNGTERTTIANDNQVIVE